MLPARTKKLQGVLGTLGTKFYKLSHVDLIIINNYAEAVLKSGS
jgi:hypothetical protein